MLQTGVLLKEVDELIRQLDDGTTTVGSMQAASLVFVISNCLARALAISACAPAAFIADLLVEDLANDGLDFAVASRCCSMSSLKTASC